MRPALVDAVFLIKNFELAGALGFEPRYVGTKNRCLTTWRRPNRAAVFSEGFWGVQEGFRKNIRRLGCGGAWLPERAFAAMRGA